MSQQSSMAYYRQITYFCIALKEMATSHSDEIVELKDFIDARLEAMKKFMVETLAEFARKMTTMGMDIEEVRRQDRRDDDVRVTSVLKRTSSSASATPPPPKKAMPQQMPQTLEDVADPVFRQALEPYYKAERGPETN